MRIFWKMIFLHGLVLKLEISYRVTISWRIFGFFERIFWRLYFCMMKCLSFHNFSFALLDLLMSMARPPLVFPWWWTSLVGPHQRKMIHFGCSPKQVPTIVLYFQVWHLGVKYRQLVTQVVWTPDSEPVTHNGTIYNIVR